MKKQKNRYDEGDEVVVFGEWNKRYRVVLDQGVGMRINICSFEEWGVSHRTLDHDQVYLYEKEDLTPWYLKPPEEQDV